MRPPHVSIVIATRNRAAVLATTLSAIARLDWPRDRTEVVVVDNGSSDDTAAVIGAMQRKVDAPVVRYVYTRRPGKSHAVNTALTAVAGDIVAFTDDDVQPDATWLTSVVQALEETGADFLAGRILPIWGAPPPAWMSPALYGVLAVPDNGTARRALSRHGGVMPIGANMAVRRDVLIRVGGLCESLGKLEGTLQTGEDHELFLRLLAAGCTGIYEPSAVVRHFVPPDRLRPSYFRRWLYQNGRDVARLQRWYPTPARTLAGIPGYLWRDAVAAAWATLRATIARDRRRRFASAVRLAWFGGYLRETVADAALPRRAGAR